MSESQPPIQLASAVDTGQILLVILYLVLIIVGAYFLTRYVAKRRLQQGMRFNANTRRPGRGQRKSASRVQFGHMVSVVDRIPIDREKTLMVVEFEGKYYLIGTTQGGIKLIDKVDMLPEDAEREAEREKDAEAAEAAGASLPQGSDEGTFGERFRKAFSIVLESYLPRGMRGRKTGRTPSFDEQLKARMRDTSVPDDRKHEDDPRD